MFSAGGFELPEARYVRGHRRKCITVLTCALSRSACPAEHSPSVTEGDAMNGPWDGYDDAVAAIP